MSKIRIAIVGVGNCTSSLLQGIEYYKGRNSGDMVGLMHWDINGYKPYDIEVVAAFDVDKRKVGKDVNEAIFERPNCTKIFCEDMPKTGIVSELAKIIISIRTAGLRASAMSKTASAPAHRASYIW